MVEYLMNERFRAVVQCQLRDLKAMLRQHAFNMRRMAF